MVLLSQNKLPYTTPTHRNPLLERSIQCATAQRDRWTKNNLSACGDARSIPNITKAGRISSKGIAPSVPSTLRSIPFSIKRTGGLLGKCRRTSPHDNRRWRRNWCSSRNDISAIRGNSTSSKRPDTLTFSGGRRPISICRAGQSSTVSAT